MTHHWSALAEASGGRAQLIATKVDFGCHRQVEPDSRCTNGRHTLKTYVMKTFLLI